MEERKTHLRVISMPFGPTKKITMELFEGDIVQDRKYWGEVHNAEARYFVLEEVAGNIMPQPTGPSLGDFHANAETESK